MLKAGDLKDIDVAVKELDFTLKYLRLEDFLFDLHNVAIAQGWTTVAKKACLSRESLYKTLAPNENPRFETIVKVLHAMGMQLQVVCSKNIPETIARAYRHNSLGSVKPELAIEWLQSKNGKIFPWKKIWWKFSKDVTHEWQTSVSRRIKGDQCPYCSSNKD